MQFSEQCNREQVGAGWAKQYRGSDFAALDLALLFNQRHRVVMNRMRELVTQRSGKLLRVLDEVHQRVGHVDVATWSGKGIRLVLVHEVELEGMGIARLR